MKRRRQRWLCLVTSGKSLNPTPQLGLYFHIGKWSGPCSPLGKPTLVHPSLEPWHWDIS